MTYEQHQAEQAAALNTTRRIGRAQMTSAQAARLARRISAQADAAAFDPMQAGTARVASAIEVARIVGGAR